LITPDLAPPPFGMSKQSIYAGRHRARGNALRAPDDKASTVTDPSAANGSPIAWPLWISATPKVTVRVPTIQTKGRHC
jgi:hypothetical protein